MEPNLNNFPSNKRTKDGLNSHCRLCHCNRNKRRYLEKRKELLSKQAEKRRPSELRSILRKSVEDIIKSDPERSNSFISELHGVSYDMVNNTRKQLELNGDIPIVDFFVNKDGTKRKRMIRTDRISKNPLGEKEVVYFIQTNIKDFQTGAEVIGPIKIGTSRNLISRMREIKTSCPGELKILLLLPGGYSLEKELHERFMHLRTHGEWHNPSSELINFIIEKRNELRFEDLVPDWGAYKSAVERRTISILNENADHFKNTTPDEDCIKPSTQKSMLSESPFVSDFWEAYTKEEINRKTIISIKKEEENSRKKISKRINSEIKEILRKNSNIAPHFLNLLKSILDQESKKILAAKGEYVRQNKRSPGWERRMPRELLLTLKNSGLELSHNICTKCQEIKPHAKFKKSRGCLKNTCYSCLGKIERSKSKYIFNAISSKTNT